MTFPRPFRFTETQEHLRNDVRSLLASPPVQRELAVVRGDDDVEHTRHTYELLGQRGWLAIDWPERFGGLDAGPVESAIVTEEIALAGIPDSPRVNTVDNIGSTVLRAGSEQQKSTYLPGIARGGLFGCVFYSEPNAGSDLGALTTSAVRDGAGWRLNGTKMWAVGAGWTDLGICAARTDDEAGSRYAGISLFLVPMRAAGVEVEPLPTVNPERFNRVSFHDVALDATALVGDEGRAWALINDALGMERTGIYLCGRALRWLNLLSSTVGERPWLAELRAELRAARLLAWRCVELMAAGADWTVAAAAAKWWNGELAGAIATAAWQATRDLPRRKRDSPAGRELAWAIREAPGLRLAAGTTEMMLSTVTTALLDNEDGVVAR